MIQFPRSRTRTPLLKRRIGPPRRGPVLDDGYLRWLRKLPCVVCGTLRWVKAAHVGERGLGQLCSDRQAIPLCELHHRTGALSHHVLQRNFWSYWGLDRYELIAWFNERYETEVKGENDVF